MSSGVVKKTGDVALKNVRRKRIKGVEIRRVQIAGAGLRASEGVNMNRIVSLIRYRCHKSYAMQEYGMKLDNFESVKERALLHCASTEAKAAIVASETIRKYTSDIVTELISDSALKASTVLNWWGNKKSWGSVADIGVKPGDITRKLCRDEAVDGYVAEAFGVPKPELTNLAHYSARIFMIDAIDALPIARQVIAVEKIFEAAFQASHTLNLLRSLVEKPTETIQGESQSESTVVVGEDELLKECQMEFSDDIYFSDESDGDIGGGETSGLEPGFLKNRDETCIFLDSKEARVQYKRLMHLLSGSSVKMNWARMTRFMEFKARKEYAMEVYGIRLGDFHSLKENARMLLRINEDDATEMASQVMEIDYESICFEKVADAAFRASKILNWDGARRKKSKKPWCGNIADASGFKSSKSTTNSCKNRDLEARKAYTMEAFGVSTVEIDYIKDFAIEALYEYNFKKLKLREAIIMACECVAIDHVVDAVSKNLELTLELEPMEPEDARAMPVLTCALKPGPNFVFSVPES